MCTRLRGLLLASPLPNRRPRSCICPDETSELAWPAIFPGGRCWIPHAPLAKDCLYSQHAAERAPGQPLSEQSWGGRQHCYVMLCVRSKGRGAEAPGPGQGPQAAAPLAHALALSVMGQVLCRYWAAGGRTRPASPIHPLCPSRSSSGSARCPHFSHPVG